MLYRKFYFNILLRQVVDLDCPDADVGDTVTYAILSGNTANVFSIDANGVLKTATRELNNMTLFLVYSNNY